MHEVADILRRYAADYIARYGRALLPRHRKAIRDLTACRTAALGGQVYHCQDCGQVHYEYHSCRNSACPKCNGQRREAWLQKRRSEMLPVAYFHLVFTLPRPVAQLAHGYPTLIFGLLFKAASEALQSLAQDRRYVGGRIGMLAVLHTWTQTLTFHPHLHCLVPAGGISPDNSRWLPANEKFLLPVKALSKRFRARFQALLRHTALYNRIAASVFNDSWVVYSKPAVQGSQRVLDYLARYVCRVAISNSRIENIEDGKVTFRYQDRVNGGCKRMEVTAQDFIGRFLQHVLPQRFIKVRYYGFWAAANRDELAIASRLIEAAQPLNAVTATVPPEQGSAAPSIRQRPPRHCAHCGSTRLIEGQRFGRPRCHSP